MLRAVIIDDIETIRKKNSDLIKTHCPNIVITAEADSVESGISIIQQQLPDIVFLDVEMPDGTGFDLLKKIDAINFKVIFITGFEDFAIKAFRSSAIDYLLKPLNPTDLIEAVKKAEKAIDKDVFDMKFSALFANLERSKNLQKIILKTSEKIFSVNIQDIIRCESEKNYTTFYLVGGTKILVSTTLKDYETLLGETGFFRPHQSHLINMAYFDYYLKSDGGAIIMKDKSSIPLSVRKKEDFLLILDSL